MEILMYCKLCVRARTVFLDPREWLSAGVDVAEFNESLLALLLELFPALNSLVEHLPQHLHQVVKAIANRNGLKAMRRIEYRHWRAQAISQCQPP